MRNKKIVFTIVAIVMTASICIFAFAGCQNVNSSLSKALAPFLEDYTEVNVTNVELTGLSGYEISAVYEDMIVAAKLIDYGSQTGLTTTQFVLYNAAMNRDVVVTNFPIRKISNLPVFYYTDTTTNKTYFYSKTGLIIGVDSELGGTTDGKFTDGRALILFDDEIILVTPTLGTDLSDFSNLEKSGDKYYAINEDGILAIFNSDRTFDYSENLAPILNYYDYYFTTLSNGYVLIQTEYELSENEALRDFSYYDDGKYFKLNTFVYDLKAHSYKQIDFNGIIGASLTSQSDSTIISVSEINADKRLSNSKIFLVNHSLNKIIDFESYLPNTTYCRIISENEVLLSDGYKANYYKDDKLVASYPFSERYDTSSGLLKAGNDFYNLSGEKIYSLSNDMTYTPSLGISNGIIYYSKDSYYYAYDSKTDSTITFGVASALTFNNCFVTYDSAEKNYITAAYNAYDCSAVFTNKRYSRISSIYYSNTIYSYLAAYDYSSGNVTYYLSYIA